MQIKTGARQGIRLGCAASVLFLVCLHALAEDRPPVAPAGLDGPGFTVPVVTSPENAVATVGLPFSYLIYGSNSPSSYAATPLPPGLTLDPAIGVISGTPTAAGTSRITISCINEGGVGKAKLALVVRPSAPAEVETYPSAGAHLSDLYTVEVSDGTDWIPSCTYKYARKSVTRWRTRASPSVHFTTLGTTGPVNIRIGKTDGPVTSLDIGPKSKRIPFVISGGKAILTASWNDKLWLTVNGDDSNPLFVFVDPPKPPIPGGATYFGPGVRDIAPASSNHYQAATGEVIYLDGGAWVRGNISVRGTSGVRIMGPGVLSGELWKSEDVKPLPFKQTRPYFMIRGDLSGNECDVQGITIVASPSYNIFFTRTATNVKLLSPWYWSTDGFYSRHVDQCFAFVGDDIFFTLWYGGGSESVTVINSFCANDNNSVVCGGYWGFVPPIEWSALTYNVDIRTYDAKNGLLKCWLDNTNAAYGYRRHTYQNIRVEGDTTGGRLLSLRNRVYPWSGGHAPNPPLGNAYDFQYKDICVEGRQSSPSEILGYDASNGFHNISIQDLKINGELVTASNAVSYITTNSYVWGLTFSSSTKMEISASAGVGGFISPRGAVTMKPGEDVTFMITPTPGYRIEDVTVDGSSAGAVAKYAFNNVTDPHTISASFVVDDR